MTATNTTKTAKDGTGVTFSIAQAAESVSTATASVVYVKDPTTEGIVTLAKDSTVAANAPGLGYATSGNLR